MRAASAGVFGLAEDVIIEGYGGVGAENGQALRKNSLRG
jgi:hypothetical protein